jgi:cell wall-associated NlpC family hydrolase
MKSVRLLLAVLVLIMTAAAYTQTSSDTAPERAKIGKLGQLKADASIYQKPSHGSRVLYKAKKDTYVAMRSMDTDWVCVVMADGSNGYVESAVVTRLPYEVSLKPKETPQAPSPPQNRGTTRMLPSGGDWRSACTREAFKYIGTPYVFGGNNLRSGIDCSGLVQQLFRMAGVEMPRTAAEQSKVGEPIASIADLKPGDRLYFTDKRRSRVTHTGLYVGNGVFIHASRSGGGVNTSQLSGSWVRNLVGARR